MERLQRELAAVAVFEDDETIDPDTALIAGVDQAFLDDETAVSAIVVMQGGAVVERTSAISPISIPYIPGLLAFREGGPVLDAFEALETMPDLVMFDGSGRIHFRQAGIATHIGVMLDIPSIGVAKSLLCGKPTGSVSGREAGTRVPIEADESVDAPPGEVIGYAVQTRQYPNSKQINPLYVSPGHRVSAATAADLVEATSTQYKLPEPTRLADSYAAEVKRTTDS
ncbi:endonuclease V [Haladaptatus sp. DJG-WS-42]|uniref:endonuclease V n=1 Tax=Haladaptatus sp. DJG-WS-42 TaxID=3120516 RepID=UPI0030CBBDD1